MEETEAKADVSAEQLVQILQSGRAIAFDRVWLAADPSRGRFNRKVDLYLVVRVGPGRTVSVDTLRRFRHAVERIVPGTTVGVDGIEAFDELDDPEDLQVLLHMTELIDRLTDRDEGLWRVTTASGTVYVLDLSLGGRSVARLLGRSQPTGDHARIPVSDLRRDGEALPLLAIGQLQLGRPGVLFIDVRRDGISTVRVTTPVVAIERLEEG